MSAMPLVLDGFDWDDANREKCRKHGVSIAEIEDAPRGDPLVAPEVTHSAAEQRSIAVGRTAEGRALFVAFMFRERESRRLIRPVSARYMHKKEFIAYEKKGP